MPQNHEPAQSGIIGLHAHDYIDWLCPLDGGTQAISLKCLYETGSIETGIEPHTYMPGDFAMAWHNWFSVGPLEALIVVAVFLALSLSATGRQWRTWVTLGLVMAAIATPADPYSMLAVAVPLLAVMIYGVSAYRRRIPH